MELQRLEREKAKLEKEIQKVKEEKRKTTENLAAARAAGRRYWLARDIPEGRYAMIQHAVPTVPAMGFNWGLRDGMKLVTAGWVNTEEEAKAALFDVLFPKSHTVEELYDLE